MRGRLPWFDLQRCLRTDPRWERTPAPSVVIGPTSRNGPSSVRPFSAEALECVSELSADRRERAAVSSDEHAARPAPRLERNGARQRVALVARDQARTRHRRNYTSNARVWATSAPGALNVKGRALNRNPRSEIHDRPARFPFSLPDSRLSIPRSSAPFRFPQSLRTPECTLPAGICPTPSGLRLPIMFLGCDGGMGAVFRPFPDEGWASRTT
jgi:hypothetical protein